MDTKEKEIHDHEEGVHWTVVHCNTLPNKARPMKSIWQLKSKRKPDGELLNHRSRILAHGGMKQWGESYWETYSPVVNILIIRLILEISKIHSLDSKAIYFVLDFPQQYLEEDIWMQLPIGFQVDGQIEEYPDKQYVQESTKIFME